MKNVAFQHVPMVGSVYVLEPGESIELTPTVYLADELTAATA